jgi:hypothetical protein
MENSETKKLPSVTTLLLYSAGPGLVGPRPLGGDAASGIHASKAEDFSDASPEQRIRGFVNLKFCHSKARPFSAKDSECKYPAIPNFL